MADIVDNKDRTDKKNLNFIESIVERDIKDYPENKSILTRFPPGAGKSLKHPGLCRAFGGTTCMPRTRSSWKSGLSPGSGRPPNSLLII